MTAVSRNVKEGEMARDTTQSQGGVSTFSMSTDVKKSHMKTPCVHSLQWLERSENGALPTLRISLLPGGHCLGGLPVYIQLDSNESTGSCLM